MRNGFSVLQVFGNARAEESPTGQAATAKAGSQYAIWYRLVSSLVGLPQPWLHSPSCNARRWPLPHSLYRAAELRRVEEVYFTAEELEALDVAQKPAAVTPERKLQIIEEMGKQMGDLGKGKEGGPWRYAGH